MWEWLKCHEYLAIWLEGIALVLIFVWDRIDSRSQHRETLQQLAISEKTANAAKMSAEVTLESVKLQRVAMEQWIDTGEWAVFGSGYIPKDTTESSFNFAFHVTNPTKFKLVLNSVDVWVDGQPIDRPIDADMPLAPDEYALVQDRYQLAGAKLSAYRDSVLVFELGARIRFTDAFGVQKEMNVGARCQCRYGGEAEFEPINFRPPDI